MANSKDLPVEHCAQYDFAWMLPLPHVVVLVRFSKIFSVPVQNSIRIIDVLLVKVLPLDNHLLISRFILDWLITSAKAEPKVSVTFVNVATDLNPLLVGKFGAEIATARVSTGALARASHSIQTSPNMLLSHSMATRDDAKRSSIAISDYRSKKRSHS